MYHYQNVQVTGSSSRTEWKSILRCHKYYKRSQNVKDLKYITTFLCHFLDGEQHVNGVCFDILSRITAERKKLTSFTLGSLNLI